MLMSGFYSTIVSLIILVFITDSVKSHGLREYLLILQMLKFLLSFAFFYIGGRLEELVKRASQLPVKLTSVGLILSLLSFSVLGVLINVFLRKQFRRLAKEAAPELEGQVLK